MLVAMSNIVFVSVCGYLVASRFGVPDQFVSSDLLSSHGSGCGEKLGQEEEGGRGEQEMTSKTRRPLK
jgi:hypothetical protein